MAFTLQFSPHPPSGAQQGQGGGGARNGAARFPRPHRAVYCIAIRTSKRAPAARTQIAHGHAEGGGPVLHTEFLRVALYTLMQITDCELGLDNCHHLCLHTEFLSIVFPSLHDI